MLRFVILAGGDIAVGFASVLDLTWEHQLILAALTLILAVWIERSSKSLPSDIDAAAAVCVFDIAVWNLARFLCGWILPQSGWALDMVGCGFGLFASDGRVLCLCGAGAGLLADTVATAAGAGAASGRSGRLA